MVEHTRRSWLVTIGQAATGLGMAGHLRPDITEASQLPRGLYLSSQEHLGHALMSADRFHPIPPGCPTDYVRPRNGPFQPLFFTAPEFAMIRRLTQLLLGEDAGVSQEVAEWIDLRVSNASAVHEAALGIAPLYRKLAQAYDTAQMQRLEKSDAVNICREGLGWISDAAQSRHASQFLDLQTEQQVELLNSISDEPSNGKSENAGSRFFGYLKAEVIRGFYTSQAGLKELDYKGNAFYVRSPGCSR